MSRTSGGQLLDPRSKLALLVAACLSVFSGMSRWQELALLVLCVLVAQCSGKGWLAIGVIALFAGMSLVDTLLVARLSGVAQYVALSSCHVLRFILPLLVAVYIMTRTATIGSIIAALTAMHLPQTLIIPLAVMFRFVPTIAEEWQAVRQAMRLRNLVGGRFGVLRHPMAAMEYMLVPFLLQCSTIVDEMSAAVMARGFDKDHPRSCYCAVRMRLLDWLVVAAAGLLTAWNLIA